MGNARVAVWSAFVALAVGLGCKSNSIESSTGKCTGAFQHCTTDSSENCETDTSSSVEHCGGCGIACNATHGKPACTTGLCAITCNPGFGDCNNDAADGCETNLTTDLLNCGKCGGICSQAHATEVCSQGQCAIVKCEPGFEDCDQQASDGCESNSATDVKHCGSCATSCETPNATSSCNAVCARRLAERVSTPAPPRARAIRPRPSAAHHAPRALRLRAGRPCARTARAISRADRSRGAAGRASTRRKTRRGGNGAILKLAR